MEYTCALWADLDRDRRMGGSKPNQNNYVIVILLTHPKFYRVDRRIAAISAENRQSGGEDRCYRGKFRNFVAWAEPDKKKQHFSRF